MTLADELSGMLDKARRYVNSAETLRREKDYDSAVSRLYYAMFYCAEAPASLQRSHLFKPSSRNFGVRRAFCQDRGPAQGISSMAPPSFREKANQRLRFCGFRVRYRRSGFEEKSGNVHHPNRKAAETGEGAVIAVPFEL